MTSPLLRNLSLVALAALLTAAPALAQSLQVEGPAQPMPDLRGGQILFAQVDGTATNGVISQNNVTAVTFDNILADDFIVPDGEVWQIAQVFVRGFYSAVTGTPAPPSGSCETADVHFFADGGGEPGDELEVRSATPSDDDSGQLTIDFDVVSLASGMYWLGVVCNGPLLDIGVVGRWNWFLNTSGPFGEPAHLINEGGGFNLGADWVSFDVLNLGPDLDFFIAGAIGTSSEGSTQPLAFSLLQNSPNPFVGTTDIHFQLDEAAEITLTVFDALGRRVSEMNAGTLSAGEQTISFDASALPAGSYFYRVQSGNQMMVRKMTVLN